MYSYTMNRADKLQYEEFLKEVKKPDEASKLWIRWKAITDLFYLGAEIFSLREAKNKRSGKYILDPVLHKQMAWQMQSTEDTLQLYPRGHLKSAWLKFRIIQCILQNPNIRIGLWTKTTSLARKELKAIKSFFSQPILQEIFPDIVPPIKMWEKDTADALTLKRPEAEGYIPQENQIEVWGIESVVTGHHYDAHFYDDVLDDKSITTTVQLDKLVNWWAHVQAIKDPEAFEKMIGTRYHYHDLYGMIMQEGYFKPENIVTRKAIENGKPIYKYFTLEHLGKLRKRMGDYVFSCQYLNEVVAMQDRIFVPPYPEWVKLPAKKIYYITVDPATGKRYSNKTGVCVACVDKEKPAGAYFVEAYQINEPTDVVAQEVVNKIVTYQPERVGIELGLQQGLKPLIDLKLQQYENLNKTAVLRPMFIEIPTNVARMSKAQKIARTLGAMVRDGRVFFKGSMKQLYYQMDMLNPNSDANEDDIVDAAAMMMMIIPFFSYAQWWKSEMNYDEGYTLENLLKKQKKPNNSWGGKFAC